MAILVACAVFVPPRRSERGLELRGCGGVNGLIDRLLRRAEDAIDDAIKDLAADGRLLLRLRLGFLGSQRGGNCQGTGGGGQAGDLAHGWSPD